MVRLKNKHKGETLNLIGKGPSLQYLNESHIGDGVVIFINHAIEKYADLSINNAVYSMQKDGGEKRKYYELQKMIPPECDYAGECSCKLLSKPPDNVPLILHDRESLFCFPNHPVRYIMNWETLGLNDNACSPVFALKLGLYMGMNKVRLICFDSHVTGDHREYRPNTGILEEINYAGRQPIYANLSQYEHEWITPS